MAPFEYAPSFYELEKCVRGYQATWQVIKRFDRRAFVLLLAMTIAAGAMSAYSIAANDLIAAKWASTTGLLATVTGVVQLEVSGLFDKIFDRYLDEERYPGGPPGYITREIVDSPDRPFATALRNFCFFNMRTGFWLIVVGTLIQVGSAWL